MDLGVEATASLDIKDESLAMETIKNPGDELDSLGVTCAMLFDRFHRTGNHQAKDGMWNALQYYNELIDRVTPEGFDEFGKEL